MSLPQNIHNILEPLGLSVHMRTDNDSPLYKDLSCLDDFGVYKPDWYKNNKELQETDEVFTG